MKEHQTKETGSAQKDEILQLVSFRIGEEEYGIEILKVQEINKMVPITKIPNAARHVEGIINLRGKILPIVNLRSRFGMPARTYDKHTRIMVLEMENGKVAGFVVDSVNEVLRFPRSITEPPPQNVTDTDTAYITSVAKLEDRLIILLDLDMVFATIEIGQLPAAA